jgi:polyhydroxyalkanoate synthesis regulator phasin
MPAHKTASSGSRTPSRAKSAPSSSRASGRSKSSAGSADGLTSIAEQLINRVIKPLDLVLLTRERIQETLDEAAERGRVTRTDANELVSELVRRGRQQTDDLLKDLERLVERGRGQLESATRNGAGCRSRAPDRGSRAIVPDPRIRRADRRPGERPTEGPHPRRAAQGARVRTPPREPQVGTRGDREVARLTRAALVPQRPCQLALSPGLLGVCRG